MTAAVQQIRREKDLSKRIGLGRGSDEIYRLGQTFDALLSRSKMDLNGSSSLLQMFPMTAHPGGGYDASV